MRLTANYPCWMRVTLTYMVRIITVPLLVVNFIIGFKYFKMKLFDQETVLESQNGSKFPVVDVISYSLKVSTLDSSSFILIN